jgi:hypothetical protein
VTGDTPRVLISGASVAGPILAYWLNRFGFQPTASRMQLWAMAEVIRLLPRLPSPVRRQLTSFGGGPAAMLGAVKLRDPNALP